MTTAIASAQDIFEVHIVTDQALTLEWGGPRSIVAASQSHVVIKPPRGEILEIQALHSTGRAVIASAPGSVTVGGHNTAPITATVHGVSDTVHASVEFDGFDIPQDLSGLLVRVPMSVVVHVLRAASITAEPEIAYVDLRQSGPSLTAARRPWWAFWRRHHH